MALTRCFECGHEISTSAAACPNCGAPAQSAKPPPVPPQRARSSKLVPLLIAGGVAVVLMVFFIGGIMLLASMMDKSNSQRKQLSAKQKLVNELTLSFRKSLLDDGTQVLQIHNPNPHSVDFYLKCYARNGSAKTLFVSVTALGMKEIGVLEGWQFQTGERFEALCDDEVVWKSEVK